jgi:ATP-dependent Clp protease ATP-binding subunit ClpB
VLVPLETLVAKTSPPLIDLDTSKVGTAASELTSYLHSFIIGQDDAIGGIVDVYQTFLAGIGQPGKPVGNFLFLGPTGSGKTRIVEVLADALFHTTRAVIKIDCAEFQHSHEISKIIGSPPGYLGHRETKPMLSQQRLSEFYTDKLKLSILLFDEIEKASDSLWNLLLGILDKATLTLGDGQRVDFGRAMIFMTSNLGAREMANLLSPRLGFLAQPSTGASTPMDDKLASKISQAGVEAARRKFTPEFINRLDKIIVFKPLGKPELEQILEIELRLAYERIVQTKAISLIVSPAAKEHILANGTDMKYGARQLRRAVEKSIIQSIANLIATAQVEAGERVVIDFDAEAQELVFAKEAAARGRPCPGEPVALGTAV